MHDWTQVRSGTYHNFHVLWMSMMTNRLNSTVLPQGYFAMAEQIIGGPEPDVVALKLDETYVETWATLPKELKRLVE